MAAKKSLLEEMHEALTNAFIERLKNPDGLTAADLTACAKFLKDNGIAIDPSEDEGLKELKERTESVIKHPFQVHEGGRG